MSVESAVAYYEYGNALLLKEEENPSNDLLGNVDAAASNDSKHVEDEDVDDEDEDAEGETEDRPKAVEEDDEPEGDLQIAWEVLDVARCILEKQSGPACKSFLSDVYMRLGDLMRFNSNVAASIEEYQKALSIRLSSCAPHDRMISDTHFSLAVAYVYNASEKDSDVDPEQEKRKALSHYKKSQEVSDLYECKPHGG
jgi:nuclear autoantigenic sperm protein